MPAQQALQFDDLRSIAYRFQESRILLSAFELGIFTALGRRRLSSSVVSRKIQADPRATDRLMNALVAMQLLKKDAKGFTNSEAASRLLARGSGEFLAGLEHMSHLWVSWSTLTEAVRKGTSVLGKRASTPRASNWLESFIAAMHDRAKIQAPAIIGTMDLSGVHRVLDVGGGPGTFAMAFVRAKRSILATVFDLPDVLPITRRYIREGHCEKKIDLASGDYTVDPLPRGYDLVFLSAIIHSNSAIENKVLLRKCVRSLNPRGRVVVQDWVMSPRRTEPVAGVFFALNMLVNTTAGDTYTEEEIISWMKEAGLARIEMRPTRFGVSQISGYRID